MQYQTIKVHGQTINKRATVRQPTSRELCLLVKSPPRLCPPCWPMPCNLYGQKGHFVAGELFPVCLPHLLPTQLSCMWLHLLPSSTYRPVLDHLAQGSVETSNIASSITTEIYTHIYTQAFCKEIMAISSKSKFQIYRFNINFPNLVQAPTQKLGETSFNRLF